MALCVLRAGNTRARPKRRRTSSPSRACATRQRAADDGARAGNSQPAHNEHSPRTWARADSYFSHGFNLRFDTIPSGIGRVVSMTGRQVRPRVRETYRIAAAWPALSAFHHDSSRGNLRSRLFSPRHRLQRPELQHDGRRRDGDDLFGEQAAVRRNE